jgi:hypothetical protein
MLNPLVAGCWLLVAGQLQVVGYGAACDWRETHLTEWNEVGR